jgi:hypothetical protein
MTDRAAGLAAVSALGDLAEKDRAPDPEQLALLDALPPGLDPENSFHQAAIEGVKRARGRPAGAENRANRDVRRLVAALGDPLIEQGKWSRHTPESLARVLGCTKLEAFDRLMALHRELAPFLYARMAPVDDKGNAVVPIFAINAPGGQVAVVGGGGMPWEGPWNGVPLDAQETQQNQGVSQSSYDVSPGKVSHE